MLENNFENGTCMHLNSKSTKKIYIYSWHALWDSNLSNQISTKKAKIEKREKKEEDFHAFGLNPFLRFTCTSWIILCYFM